VIFAGGIHVDLSEYGTDVQLWMENIEKYRGVDAEKTLQNCTAMEKYASANNDEKLLGIASYYAGETYYILNDGENLFKYITKALSCLEQAEEWELVAQSYNIIAITAASRGNAPVAMDYYLSGLNYCRKYNLKWVEQMLNINLGGLYLENGQYLEAQKYYEEALQQYSVSISDGEKPDYNLLSCIYIGIGKCLLLRNMPEKAQEYMDRLEQECNGHLDKLERLFNQPFCAEFYHATGRTALRDECIRDLHENTTVDMPVMDIFDDYYDFCEMLLEIEKDDEFWDILEILETLCKSTKITNLQRKIAALKVRYFRIHRKNAEYLQAAGLYFELSEVMERDNRAMISSMMGVRTSLERANERRLQVEKENLELQKKSETDALTKLANRFRLNTFAEHAFERALKEQTPLAVEILDIDYFKQYNDNYGHQAGDACLTAIAKVLRAMQNNQIFCARYGGDEFIVIYENMTEAQVRESAERLRQQIMDLKIAHAYSLALPIVTISQGICYDIPIRCNKNWDFLYRADNMLYQGKKASRNSVCLNYLNVEEEV
jgi:diguanylate cyclase (GGDEF)-like protein